MFDPIQNNVNQYKIITPSVTKTGDYLPVVVHTSLSDSLINTKINGQYILSAGNANIEIEIKKGVGCTTYYVQETDDFNLSIGNASKAVHVLNSVDVQLCQGQLDESSTDWEYGLDYYITNDLTIPKGTTLEIQPGAQIFLDKNVNIIVNGALQIKGTEEDPVLFISQNWEQPWGGIQIDNGIAQLKYCFLINGGADETKTFGHSNSQPLIFADESEVEIIHCYIVENIGKALGSIKSEISVSHCLLSRCDTGGEFHRSLVHIKNTHVLNIPNNNHIFIDDDNDGFYFAGHYPNTDTPSLVEDCFIVTGKDDAIDHNNSKLEIIHCWLEDFMHEGVAGSNGNYVKIFNSIIKHCENGIEAGYGEPSVYVDHCILTENDVGIRFGDSYDWGCYGKMIITNSICYNNQKSIYNFDLLIQAPKDDAIDISYSMTNDDNYDHYPNCISGIPLFDEDYILKESSPGKKAANDGNDIGLIND